MQNTNFLEYEFKKKEKIGSGSFGTVYKSFSQKLNKDVALKMFREYISKENENPKEEIIDEIKIMSERELVHVNIIQLFGITQDPDTKDYGLVLQYANQGTLRAYLETHFSKLEWPDKFRMAREIASGINYLHSKKIVHRDLHDKNVLVHNDSLIVADFGLSKLSDNTSKTHIHPNGFPAYRDPNYIKNNDYKRLEPSDIYSFGVLLWELSSGKRPFKGMNDGEIERCVISGKREERIDGTPDDFRNLYVEAWDEDLNRRPPIGKICLELDIQLCSHQITSSLKKFFSASRSHEDGAYFFARVFRDLVLDENFVAFRWNFLAFFFQALKDWSWERDAKKLEELEKKIVTTFQLGKALENTKKFVKVSSFSVAVALVNSVVIANFYFQDAVRVFLNCFSAAVIITLAAVTSSEEAKKTFCVAVYAVESFVIALNVSFLNTGIVFFLNIFFATVNAAFTNLSAFDVYKEDFKGFLVFALYVLNVLMVVVKFVFYTFIIAVKLVAILAKDHKEFFAVFAANVAALAAYWSYQKIT